MYKLGIMLAFFLLASPKLFAQNQDNKLLIEEYLRQSEKQKKAGITMIAVGASAALIGTLLAASSDDWDDFSFGGGVILFTGGSAAAILGVPLIISSASKARKAAQLSLGANSARVIFPNGASRKIYPAIQLSIPINSSNRWKNYWS